MTKKPFATRIIEAMNERGLSAMDLHRATGVSYDVINKLKQRPDSSTKADNARALASYLGIDVDADQGGDSGATMIDVYDVHASAGNGAIVEAEEVIDRLSFPVDYLRRVTKTAPKHLAIIGVKGDSMEPTLRDDDVVMLDATKCSLDYDGLFVLRWGDALHVKRIGRARSDSVRIISDNASIYPPVEIPREEIHVVGKVIWIGKKV